MSEPLSTDPYKGVRDFYPQDWATMTYLFEVLRRTLRLYGYEEYHASPLERAELYESKTSEEIVSEQTYTFTDRGERRVTLRPEMTPTLARMIAARRREIPFPARWFSIPNVFRYERPQRGRLREHYQLNVDLLGVADQSADEEVIRLAARLLQAFGATTHDFVIRVSSRKLLTAAMSELGLSADQTKQYLSLLDRKNKISSEAFEQARAEFRRNGTDPLEYIEAATTGTVADHMQELTDLISSLTKVGVTNVVFDPTIVRGFLYYTGIVFEVFDSSPENARSLFGGGRYDNLVSVFGGEQLPAVGFGMGDVTLLDFLTTHSLLPTSLSPAPTLFIGTPAGDDVSAAMRVAEQVRSEGVRAIVHTSGKPLSDQIKEAVRRAIPFFMAVGQKEQQSGTFTLKDLAKSTQHEGSLAEIVRILG